MAMDFRHWLLLAAIFVAGFWVAKKYPSLFASVPFVNSVLA